MARPAALAALRHAVEQGPMLRALGGVALASLVPTRAQRSSPSLPGPWVEADLEPRSPSLVRDYIEYAGGDPAAYAGHVPAHLFPQWGFPLLVRTLEALPYPYARAVNAGCRIEQRSALPAREPLSVRARVESVDDDGRRAILVQRLDTGTLTAPDAIRAEIRVHVKLGGKHAAPRREPTKEPRPTVPADARPIATLDLDARAGLAFAALTGDFNPIHWVPLYARAAGFGSTILHGFATLARTVEALNRGVLGGDPARLGAIDVRFTKPLVLPARVSVYTGAEDRVWVAAAPGQEPFLEGSFQRATEKLDP
jgi:acyl dehydratase